MYALTMGSYAVLGIVCLGSIYWIYRLGLNIGASRQKDKDERVINEWLKENAPDIYNGHIGIDALRVSSDDAWGEDTRAGVEIRIVSDKAADGGGDASGNSG